MGKKIGLIILGLGLASTSTGCTQLEQRAAGYGAGGAAVGALAGGVLSQSPGGALAGAALGAATGSVVGSVIADKYQNTAINTKNAQLCRYKDSKNRSFEAPCKL